MALKRSWPAVSQIWALTVPPAFSVTPLVANSTPIVGYLFLGNSFLIYRLNRCVLPTPVSPTRITIKTQKMAWFLNLCKMIVDWKTKICIVERTCMSNFATTRIQNSWWFSSSNILTLEQEIKVVFVSCINRHFLFFVKCEYAKVIPSFFLFVFCFFIVLFFCALNKIIQNL